MISTNERPDDLMSLKDACKLVPSPYGGSRGVHLSTFRRWVLTGKLRYWRCGKWLMVSRSDVMGLFEPVAKPAPVEAKPAVSAHTREGLKRHGLDRYL